MLGVENQAGSRAERLEPLIAGLFCSAASPIPFFLSAEQSNVEMADSLLHLCLGSQAFVPGGRLSRRAPDGHISVEIRAVARQVHRLQRQTERPQVLPDRLAPMGRSVVPDHVQWSRVLSFSCIRKVAEVPSTPPPPSPSTPPNSSWPSRRALGWSSPPVQVLPHASALFTLALV